MTDKFTITLEYDRDEILSWAQKCKDKNDTWECLGLTRGFLDQMFPAWRLNQRTYCLVELMFRDEGDVLRPIYVEKLAELDAKENA